MSLQIAAWGAKVLQSGKKGQARLRTQHLLFFTPLRDCKREMKAVGRAFPGDSSLFVWFYGNSDVENTGRRAAPGISDPLVSNDFSGSAHRRLSSSSRRRLTPQSGYSAAGWLPSRSPPPPDPPRPRRGGSAAASERTGDATRRNAFCSLAPFKPFANQSLCQDSGSDACCLVITQRPLKCLTRLRPKGAAK